MAAIQALLADAVARHRAGRVAEAEDLYRQTLAVAPGQPDALHLLGVLALQGGRAGEAVGLIEQALAADPAAPTFLANYGHALDAVGRGGDAAAAFARALAELVRRGRRWEDIGDLAELTRRYPLAARRGATAAIAAGLSPRDPIRRESLLFYLDGDTAHYQALTAAVFADPRRFSLPMLHYAYWGMTMQLFRGQAAAGDMGAMSHAMYRFYALLAAETARRYGVAGRLTPGGDRAAAVAGTRPLRLALVANQMLGDGHQPTVDAFDIARRLQDDHGCEIVIVNANTMATVTEDGFWPTYQFHAGDYAGAQSITAQGGQVRMMSFPAGRFVADRLCAIVDWVQQYDPDVVLALGGSNIIADLLVPARPVICLPTSSGPSASLAQMVLGYADNETGAGWPDDLRARFRPFVFGFAAPPAGPDLPRQDFGLPAAGPVFVTIGNRLDIEVDAGFLAMVDEVLGRLPDAVWLMAGEVKDLPSRIRAMRHAGRVLAPGHVAAVRPLFRLCTAYVNPRRQGGGGSASFALAEGVAVVSPATGDVAAVAGTDFIVADDRGMVDRCVALAEDPAFRATQAAAARARYRAAGDRGPVMLRLLDYCAEAIRS